MNAYMLELHTASTGRCDKINEGKHNQIARITIYHANNLQAFCRPLDISFERGIVVSLETGCPIARKTTSRSVDTPQNPLQITVDTSDETG